MLDVQFGGASHPGKYRASNEEAMGSFIPSSCREAQSHGYLFAVADGTADPELGGIAALTAISVVTAEFAKAANGSMLISLLPRLVLQANAAVNNHMLANRTLTRQSWTRQIVTTLLACALRYDQAVITHLGDSRCYLVRAGLARRLTQDCMPLHEPPMLRLNSAAEADQSPGGHAPARVPGETLRPETTALSVQAQDVLVLSTVGLHARMSDAQLASIAGQRKSAAEIARELVARSVELDGNDNAAAQVIRVRAIEQGGAYRGRTYRLAG